MSAARFAPVFAMQANSLRNEAGSRVLRPDARTRAGASIRQTPFRYKGESSNMFRLVQSRMMVLFSLVLATAGLPARLALAQEVGSFYRGKTLTMIVSNSAGGGYDLLTRTIARHLGRHLPGAPAVVVQNMPGAGGLIATNYLYSVASKAGTVIASLSNNVPFEPLFGTKDARYDPERLNWLGSPSVETGIVTVWHSVPVKSLEDARRHEITIPANGANSTPSFYARLLNETLGTRMRIILGYPGQNEMYTAMERGEVDANSSVFYSSLVATRPAWLRDKQVTLLVQYGLEKHPGLGEVPFAPELVTTADDRALMYAAFAPLAVGRPYAMPPGVPADRVTAMQNAFLATFHDPEFIADAERQKLDVSTPRSGEQLLKVIRQAYSTPQHIVARLRRLSAAEIP